MVVQACGVEISKAEIITKIKDIWVADGNKVKDLKNLVMYVKPEERKVYYVINDDVNGEIEV